MFLKLFRLHLRRVNSIKNAANFSAPREGQSDNGQNMCLAPCIVIVHKVTDAIRVSSPGTLPFLTQPQMFSVTHRATPLKQKPLSLATILIGGNGKSKHIDVRLRDRQASLYFFWLDTAVQPVRRNINILSSSSF